VSLSLLQQLHEWLAQHPTPTQVLVAYSGGRDSHVLLHLLSAYQHQYQPSWHLAAVHVNHQLAAEADAWQQHCHTICAQLQIPFTYRQVQASPPPGESPEAYARTLRYQALSQLMAADTLLMTAHYQQDQAETLLLQLLRGSGPQGLSGIKPYQAYGQGALGRPLLEVSEAQLVEYAQQQQLHWVEDPSNQSLAYDRNYLRHQVLPQLQARWPSAAASLSRSAQLLAQSQAWIEQQAQQDLQLAQVTPTKLDLTLCQSLAPERQQWLFRAWLQQLGQPLPSQAQLHNGLAMLLTARPDAMPCWSHGQGQIRRYRQQVYWVQPADLVADWQADWTLLQPLNLAALGMQLLAEPCEGEGLAQARITGKVQVSFRQGGETLQPVGRTGHHRLKHLFQEAAIPPWLRGRTPLIWVEGCLVSVVGHWLAEGWQAGPGQPGWRLRLVPLETH